MWVVAGPGAAGGDPTQRPRKPFPHPAPAVLQEGHDITSHMLLTELRDACAQKCKEGS